MDQGLQDFAAKIVQLDRPSSVWSTMSRFAEAHGFPFCTLTMASQKESVQSSRFMTSLPHEFRNTYCDEGLISDDPFLSLICTNMAAVTISTNPKRFPEIDHRQEMFLDLTRSLGVLGAICVPVSTNAQPEFGGWIFGGRRDRVGFEQQINHSGTSLQMAALIASERITALSRRKGGSAAPLSPRERECLLWLSEGLRVKKIAHRLGISESAVTLYVRNARRKLGALTREQAVARAIQCGEIQP